ncbi:Mitochondrial oxaloacetate carrier protein [Friedmanniomyces endolithicus]|uniref:Mitochondrial oxaloacetate carrier protein n=1 Tax=Friedmanniomyces endolithicus TaxID=329885 RepID=A0A4U0V0P8_9PEZI|nr:Mitochondrial oxaloacetate carrier protein [Friedmanniomyces endolithicus]KAK0334626.1 Mitochondrial oxaloacetate carrier protein [Friedmanniomyces endolithicus]KAK0771580.1 Mitochondrial oxaloacetate carrier protein [Friedmanniomyces endolithicus]KAK0787123.1 Mitochondrial oxaloacetate carrier protein [Friedmanniomyces endolithicus]KAK0794493.1 Mitochondrial oxaloacetate carrier protein [Friedmanniomyces endolithicus]
MSTTIGSFIAGGIAACGAVTVTHSFETVKIRLQLQGELQAKSDAPKLYRGVLHGVRVIYQNEGMKGLLRGLSCAYIYQMTLNGCRLGFYDPIRTHVNSLVLDRDLAHASDARVKQYQSLPINIFSGATSGILGAAAGSPFFLVKTRLQSYSPFLPVGTQHKYRNAWDGLSQIYRAEGVRGLYRGVGPAMVRTGFGSSVQLPTYFLAKRRLVSWFDMPDGAPLHLLSSAASGVVVCIVMHPPDTVMSRMYNQTGNLYSGAFDCLFRTVKTEGVLAVYKGFFAHLARILPHTILTLSLAEQTMKLMRRFEERALGIPDKLKVA